MSDKWYISGPLGIGTTPDRPLHVTDGTTNLRFGSEADIAVFRVENTKPSSLAVLNLQNDVQAWQLRIDGADGNKFRIFDATAPKSPLTIDRSGNVGIGTPDPKATLSVGGANSTTQIETSTVLHLLRPGVPQVKNSNSMGFSVGAFEEGGNGRTRLDIMLSGNPQDSNQWGGIPDVTVMTLRADGNVGIGTTVPTAGKLQFDNVLGNKIVVYDNGATDRYGFGLNGGNLNAFVPAGGRFSVRQNGYDGTELMTVTGAGNVGIGTAEPKAKLDVSGNVCLMGKQALRGDDSWLRLNQENHFSEGVHTPGLFNCGSLYVGGTITYVGQLNKLDVAERNEYAVIRAHDLLLGHSSRGKKGEPPRQGNPDTRDTIGRALVDSADEIIQVDLTTKKHLRTLVINYGRDWEAVLIHGHVNTPSSRRIKDNIEALSSEVAQAIISALEPVTYFYKNDELRLRTLGFVAEDAPAEVASPNRESITFNHIVAALTRVVKDQAQSISDLKAQVELLMNNAAATKTS